MDENIICTSTPLREESFIAKIFPEFTALPLYYKKMNEAAKSGLYDVFVVLWEEAEYKEIKKYFSIFLTSAEISGDEKLIEFLEERKIFYIREQIWEC